MYSIRGKFIAVFVAIAMISVMVIACEAPLNSKNTDGDWDYTASDWHPIASLDELDVEGAKISNVDEINSGPGTGQPLRLFGAGTVSFVADYNADDSSSSFNWYINGEYGANMEMTLTEEGNLGIGTTPQNKLDVEGGVAIGTNYAGTEMAPTETDGMIIEGNVLIGASEQPSGRPAEDYKLYVTGGNVYMAGKLGVGIYPDPLAQLNVDGTVRADGYWLDVVGQCFGNPDGPRICIESNTQMDLYSNINTMTLKSGKVGIGTTDPGTKLAVVGLPSTTNQSLVRIDRDTGDFYIDSSSQRYKEDIQDFEGDFDKILDAEPKSYVDKASGQRDIGYIAEDFDELGLTDLVIYNGEGEPDGLKYDRISLYLVEIIEAQQAQIEDLLERVEALEQANQ